jgi:hypothetical protein
VRDGVIRRLIGKWLNAGGMESGSLVRSETGTPQGGVIADHHPLNLPSRSKSVIRGAGCLNWACPDL